MPNMTLSIPKELKVEMDSVPEINWSEVARKAIFEKAREFKLFKSVLPKSRKLKLSDINKAFNRDLISEVDTTKLIREMRDKRYG